MPSGRSIAIHASAMRKDVQSKGISLMMHHLNAFITPVAGLSEYKSLSFSGIELIEYATGVRYCPTESAKGTICARSRHFTLKEERKRPSAVPKIRQRRKKTGKSKNLTDGK